MDKNQLPKKKPLNKFIRLSGVGLQMGITIYVAAYFGKKIDAHYQFEKNYITLILILFAFVGTLISLMAQLKKINEKEE
ncbi:MAG: AtpZ/AtpI family protein [Polaribacter sp.]|jgi:membrane protein DedA with SNARE-associated domain|nr:AtpZ/AtpI family protein [Polaribacter sp.]MDG1954746.1 AtpZ/AtpI family protein [Polaribacter sp.]MDG2074727.1 AtpZ/AtpI family protein [Polaribacter sp.]